MYIESNYTNYRNGEQRASRAKFLILLHPNTPLGYRDPIRAIVREVALKQLGQWMFGSARAFGHRISLCGAYGNSGLTVSVPVNVYEQGVRVPDALREKWNTGGGHNDAGSEAEEMREWALANLEALLPKRSGRLR